MRYLALICMVIFYAAGHADPAQVRAADAPVDTAAGLSESSKSEAGAVKRLSLSELVQRVVAQNQQIQIQEAQWGIKQAEEYVGYSSQKVCISSALRLESTPRRQSYFTNSALRSLHEGFEPSS